MNRRIGHVVLGVATGLAAVVGLAHAVVPERVRAAGLDVWNLGSLAQQLADADTEAQRLDALHAENDQRTAARRALLADLDAGRVTLAEVTDRFQAMNADYPLPNTILDANPGVRGREATARAVVLLAVRGAADPSHRLELGKRLEDEFHTLFPGAGPLVLADPTPPDVRPHPGHPNRRWGHRPGRVRT